MNTQKYRHPNYSPRINNNNLINKKYITPNKKQYYQKLYFSDRQEFMSGKNLIIKIQGNEYIYPPKAGFIIFNKTKKQILVVKNRYSAKTKWGLPKGHQEESETSAECATRELYEETSLKLNIDMDITPTIKINNSLYYIIHNHSNIKFKVKPNDTNEIKEACFKKISHIKKLSTNKELSIIITKKLKYIKSIAKKI